ncbi:cytochrome c3 family protein [Caldichromatium japonicum]|nr:cytochrome c3 family protein [Caldichromatium japonicum]
MGESEAGIELRLGTTNADCLRCHRMQTLAYRDRKTGEIIDLSIDPQRFARSVHGAAACIDCHEGGFDRYPHSPESLGQRLSCLGCHEQDERLSERDYRFATIRDEFNASIHATSDAPEAQGFDCHRCHDPHVFRNAQIGQPLAEIVRADNQLCLSCHEAVRKSGSGAHLWLPKRDKHWAAVRCLECHTPLTPAGQPVSHQILAAKDSNTDCVNCHAKESRLLDRLYRYRAENDLKGRGLWSQAIFNESYVVGMSRSPLLDALGLGLIALTVLGLGAHAWGRYLAYRRFKGSQP